MKSKPQPVLHVFLYNMRTANKRPINPFPLEVEATCLGHALQKIAAALSDDCIDVSVWKRNRFDDKSISS